MTTALKENNEGLTRLWRSHIDQWSVSGLSQSEYCRQNDLSRHRFGYWKTKFKKLNLPIKFVQISEPIPVNPVGLKLNIGHRLQIEIPDRFSPATLEQVLVTLKVL